METIKIRFKSGSIAHYKLAENTVPEVTIEIVADSIASDMKEGKGRVIELIDTSDGMVTIIDTTTIATVGFSSSWRLLRDLTLQI